MSDKKKKKIPLYFGLSLYIVASLICLFAQDEWSLIAARILQALGGCVGVVIARAAIRDRLDIQTSAQAFSSMMIVMGIAPIIAPMLGAWILHFFSWHAVFACLSFMGVIYLLCVHFFFKETLPVSRRLNLNFNQVLQLYMAILKDGSFRAPMIIGCFSGGLLFCYISSSAAVLMDSYGLSQQQFAYAFGANAFGIMVFSTINKHLVTKTLVIQRLRLGAYIQLFGVVVLLMAALFESTPLVWVMLGMFLTVSGIGFTGPNAMALAMSKQGARAGTASALMGSLQFACGLIGGLILNFMLWSALLNMAGVMLIFVVIVLFALSQIQHEQTI